LVAYEIIYTVNRIKTLSTPTLNIVIFEGTLHTVTFKKMQVLSMFRSPCVRRFPPKIIIIRIGRGETIKDRGERGEGLLVFGLW
jgi:hypothetical protein